MKADKTRTKCGFDICLWRERHIKTFNVHYENEGRKSSCAFATTTADRARELVKQTFPRAIISKVEVLR